jgi:hypothetical protein
MATTPKRRTNNIERRLFVIGLILFAAVAALTLDSLVFLSQQMIGTFSNDIGNTNQSAKFDVEGFKKLGL